MISNYDKKYNRVSKLYKSKWTSLKKLNGWKHYEVINIDKQNNKIELFAVCQKEKRVIVKKEELKNKNLWLRGWDSKVGIGNKLSLIDQLVEGTLSRKQASREVRQIARRKTENRMLDRTNENQEM
tara:strand:- start:372 stop:749 length:378 start_codon:yes stop_codon:yes gene_type:complete